MSGEQDRELARTLEALLFLAPEPVAEAELADALECSADELAAALARLREDFAPGERGLVLRRAGRGLDAGHRARGRGRRAAPARAAAHAAADAGAGRDAGDRRLPAARLAPGDHADPRRQRGLGGGHAARARARSRRRAARQFGAVLYRTTPLFLKLFGLASLDDLPDPAAWDPTPEEEADLRERLLRAGEARAAGDPAQARA